MRQKKGTRYGNISLQVLFLKRDIEERTNTDENHIIADHLKFEDVGECSGIGKIDNLD